PDPADVRDKLKAHLQEHGIPMMIYYPVPLYDQPAFAQYWPGGKLPVTEALCASVFSLPMHSELTDAMLGQITEAVKDFFKQH
ncbi:MAG: DegT/DnrJ/EryC1/StrS aminotransferase family protein, partial [Saprospiraceae bacterium]|nr:DegT/DnrJ/EryC1/StrS aminotransferase family protein [Saprospiraceae bacterium]